MPLSLHSRCLRQSRGSGAAQCRYPPNDRFPKEPLAPLGRQLADTRLSEARGGAGGGKKPVVATGGLEVRVGTFANVHRGSLILINEPNPGYDLSPMFAGVHLGCRQNCRQLPSIARLTVTDVPSELRVLGPWSLCCAGLRQRVGDRLFQRHRPSLRPCLLESPRVEDLAGARQIALVPSQDRP